MPTKGSHATDEARQKMSLARKGRPLSPEHRANIGKSLRGNKHALGYRWTEEERRKISIVRRGKKRSEETRKNISNGLMGHFVTDEARQKIKEYHTGLVQSVETRARRSIALSGENGPNWQGGLTAINEILRKSSKYEEWRNAVYNRDSFTCGLCNKRGGDLHAHHIKTRSNHLELIFDIDNGITLCKSCHRKTFGREDEYIGLFTNNLIILKKENIDQAEKMLEN